MNRRSLNAVTLSMSLLFFVERTRTHHTVWLIGVGNMSIVYAFRLEQFKSVFSCKAHDIWNRAHTHNSWARGKRKQRVSMFLGWLEVGLEEVHKWCHRCITKHKLYGSKRGPWFDLGAARVKIARVVGDERSRRNRLNALQKRPYTIERDNYVTRGHLKH